MNETITLKPMTYKMYHAFFKEYRNDPDLYLDKKDFREYRYDPGTVDAYIQKQIDLKRLPFAILLGEQIVGELKLYQIEDRRCATLGITMKDPACKDRGFGTQAERLAVRYVFDVLDIPVLYADTVLTNTRSQHVLEKVGFQFVREDETKKYYQIVRTPESPAK